MSMLRLINLNKSKKAHIGKVNLKRDLQTIDNKLSGTDKDLYVDSIFMHLLNGLAKNKSRFRTDANKW